MTCFSSGRFSRLNNSALADSDSTNSSPDAGDVARQLSLVFANLQHSAYRSHDPSALVTALEIDPEEPEDVTETRTKLLKRLMEHPTLGTFIRGRFGGTCYYRLACSGCSQAPESSSKPSEFLELDLNVCSTLQQALHLFMKAEEIEYRCEHCTCAVGLRHIEIRKLPLVLCLQIKRYKRTKDKTTKVETAIIFPEFLDESWFEMDTASAGSSNQPSRAPSLATDGSPAAFWSDGALGALYSASSRSESCLRVLADGERRVRRGGTL